MRSHLRVLWIAAGVVSALAALPRAARPEEEAREPRRAGEERVTVHGTRLPCLIAIPFQVRGPHGIPVPVLPRGGVRARLNWYGDEVELPIERVEPGDPTVRLTLLVDTTPGVMDFNRAEVLELAYRLLDSLDLDDEIRFMVVEEFWGLQDSGILSLRQLYEDVGRHCRQNPGDCPEIVTPWDAEEAIRLYLRATIGRGQGDVSIRFPLTRAGSAFEGFGRNALVAVSDFQYQCCAAPPSGEVVDLLQAPANEADPPAEAPSSSENFCADPFGCTTPPGFPQMACDARPTCINPRGTLEGRKLYKRDLPPASIFLTRVSPETPAIEGWGEPLAWELTGFAHEQELWPGRVEETARFILERIPQTFVAIADAGDICAKVRECAVVRMELGEEAAAAGYEIASERCVPVETPRHFARRVRKIKDPDERATATRIGRTSRRRCSLSGSGAHRSS